MEALDAICDHLKTTDWSPGQKEAIRNFQTMAHEIARYRRRREPISAASIDQLVEALRDRNRS